VLDITSHAGGYSPYHWLDGSVYPSQFDEVHLSTCQTAENMVFLFSKEQLTKFIMEFDIKTKSIDLTDAILAAVQKKMAKLGPLVERFGDSVSAEVEVGKTTGHHAKGPYFRAEVHVRLPGKLVYADAESEDLYIAVREARDKAQRQILDYKETLSDRSGVEVADTDSNLPPDEA
jgi:ribosomal subunit interface protein